MATAVVLRVGDRHDEFLLHSFAGELGRGMIAATSGSRFLQRRGAQNRGSGMAERWLRAL